VNWEQVRAETERLTTHRDIPGPIKTRADARIWKDSWDLNLVQEHVILGYEGDQDRAREYWNSVIDRMVELEKPKCKWYVVRREYCRSE
jgi:hypothetical protein